MKQTRANPQQPPEQPRNLVELYFQVMSDGGVSKTAAVAAMNDEAHTRHKLSRVGEWARQRRPTPVAVRPVLLKKVLPTLLLKRFGVALSDQDRNQMAALLS